MPKVAFGSPQTPFLDPNVPLWVRIPRIGGQRGSTGARQGPDAPHPEPTGPLRGPAPPCPPHSAQPPRPCSLTHHGKAGVSGAGGSRFFRRRQQLQQIELRRASATPHSLPAGLAAAAARPNGPSTATARAPPRPAPPRPAHVPSHCGSRGSLRASLRVAAPSDLQFPPGTVSRFAAGRACTHPPRDYFPSPRAPTPVVSPLSSTAEGHARRRVTSPCVSRAAIGLGPWRK